MTWRQLLIVTAVAISAAGCASTAKIALNDRTAQTGSAVASVALAGMDHFVATEADLVSKQKMLNLAAGTMTVEQAIAPEAPHYGDQLTSRIEAFEALEEVYAALAELSESTAPADVQLAATRLGAATAAVSSLPAAARSDFGDLAAQITALGEARTLTRRNSQLALLAARYGRLWRADEPFLEAFVDEDLKEYQRLLIALPPDRFDAVHLASAVKQPFAREMNAAFYKVESIAAARSDAAELEGELATIGRALDLLSSVHRQLSRPEPALHEATAALDQIDRLIGTKKQ